MAKIFCATCKTTPYFGHAVCNGYFFFENFCLCCTSNPQPKTSVCQPRNQSVHETLYESRLRCHSYEHILQMSHTETAPQPVRTVVFVFFKLAPQATAGGPGPMRASLFNIVLHKCHTHTHTHRCFVWCLPAGDTAYPTESQTGAILGDSVITRAASASPWAGENPAWHDPTGHTKCRDLPMKFWKRYVNKSS